MRSIGILFRHFALVAMVCWFAATLPQQSLAQQQGTSTCLAIAGNRTAPKVEPASLRLAQLASDEVRISYVGHSAFRIESPQGISIITDFNGTLGSGSIPTVVTMNHAHSTHYTDYPSPEIQHVLRGWNPDGTGPAKHWLELNDVLVRNVATDIYREGFLMEANGNSIFIFEIAGLCIGHLGHLHHKLTPEHIAAIGRLDILFMPVDGTYTMSQEGMIELAGQLRSSMVFPMHYFSTFSLQRFIAGMEGSFETVLLPQNEIVVSLKTLPQNPQVVVLPPY
jgi:L-ascorbate metabolism protein UlaG (beta-lactamase superfamily)